MSDSANEPGVHEYFDAEFIIEGVEAPAREKALQEALGKLPGLQSLSISHGKVMAHYEPVLLSRKQLAEAIEQAGFQITDTHSTASSPLTDAFAEENKAPENT